MRPKLIVFQLFIGTTGSTQKGIMKSQANIRPIERWLSVIGMNMSLQSLKDINTSASEDLCCLSKHW